MSEDEVAVGSYGDVEYYDERFYQQYNARIRRRRRAELAALSSLALALCAVIWWILTNTVIVPDLTGLDRGEAAIRLTAAELTVGEVTTVRSNRYSRGEISQQSPLPGLRALKGTDVDLGLARQLSAGPDGVGDGVEDEEYASYDSLGDGGWKPDNTTQPDPRTYSEDFPGDVVPMVQALTKKEAVAKLEDAGYRARVRFGATSSGPGRGLVFFQYPAAYDTAEPGTTVEVWVSTGGPPTGRVAPVPREAE